MLTLLTPLLDALSKEKLLKKKPFYSIVYVCSLMVHLKKSEVEYVVSTSKC